MKKGKQKVDVRLSEDVLVTLEGVYSPAYAGRMYCNDGSGEPPEPAEYNISAVYDEKGNDITALFDVFDSFLSEEVKSIKERLKCKYSVGHRDVWEWLSDLAVEKLQGEEDEN